jgi:acyl-ACP thioesterase
MSGSPSILKKTFRVTSSDVDLWRRMRPSVLFRLVQEAAIAHTEALGMGREKTLDRGILWIVTLQSAEIRRMPEYDDDLVLRSWPGETMHVLFPRYFALDTEAGEPLVRVSAIWTLLDAEKRSMVFPEKAGIHIDGGKTGDEIALPSPPRPVPFTDSADFTVPYSYVDLNGHMNNTRYFDLAEDLLPYAKDGRRLTRLSTEFAREIPLGETVSVRWGEENGRVYLAGLPTGAALPDASGPSAAGNGPVPKPSFRMSLTYEI